jgi:hypothetical protein
MHNTDTLQLDYRYITEARYLVYKCYENVVDLAK